MLAVLIKTLEKSGGNGGWNKSREKRKTLEQAEQAVIKSCLHDWETKQLKLCFNPNEYVPAETKFSSTKLLLLNINTFYN